MWSFVAKTLFAHSRLLCQMDAWYCECRVKCFVSGTNLLVHVVKRIHLVLSHAWSSVLIQYISVFDLASLSKLTWLQLKFFKAFNTRLEHEFCYYWWVASNNCVIEYWALNVISDFLKQATGTKIDWIKK